MIEHLDRREARSFLAEARRVLRPGGVLRLAAPDLSRLVDQ
jgi:predicted SAM-dependent methyltransferase